MTKQELKRAKEFLDFFGVKYDGDVIYETSGGNSIILNPNTEWKEFLGMSINSVVRNVAHALGKKTEYID